MQSSTLKSEQNRWGGNRVVITGLGTVTPVGCDKKEFWLAVSQGKSGIKPIKGFDTTDFDVRFAGEVQDFDPSFWFDQKQIRRLDPFVQYAFAASKMAVDDSGLDFAKEDPTRVGVIIGSGMGGLQELEAQHTVLMQRGPSRISPFMITKLMINAASGYVAIHYGLRGPNLGVVSACATGAHAIGEAFRLLQRGDVDVVISGGSEAVITPLGVAAFSSMKALSTRNDDPQSASRPFDRDRDGFVLAEGAGVVILEELWHARKRGAHIYAEVLGYGLSADGSHMAAPDPNGRGAIHAIESALKDARCSPKDIAYINAHATSTPLGDEIEAMSISKVFDDYATKVPVSSTKSMMGHLLGAAGAVELIVCVLAMQEGVIPPTINYENPDPKCCKLDFVPKKAREAKVDMAMSNSFGFGGHNVTLVVGRERK
ncbi:MAG: beta-ketoacyl-[acyl-carrier-protein] synthase II [Planctomycetes bacterium RIFCSPHIGHO2_02_FULL_50_42]|nr:MAG: beta-ketoacyl-[acyl-carrier-protein] synthase II [Planctomycetes bacterium RIFCSPHIGHO2_02_FULL_50_42]OHB95036.1 MAG: beta-ketoacyl-[acyl-carrier-protein] synthase II [Planctomycetes bacterium RIFCSPLOWO2_02_FULL_50_16]OHC03542.1 MAG: beta-ketoacyl-[acyl-carrier-protein] synthase II [Planctomycetes bacterium RIFCSPLOWO2_12_FULL_50_35]